MRALSVFSIFFISTCFSFAQSNFPSFLQGTWKMDNKAIYERWDKLNEQALKGFSYQMKNGQMFVTEFLEISEKNNKVTYTASVVNQNKGLPVSFKMTRTDSTYSFENPEHDFPKLIVYQKLSDTVLLVKVSDGGMKSFSYHLRKSQVQKTPIDSSNTNPNYDQELAQKLGGDDYGMKAYVLVVLKTGQNTTSDKTLINERFRGHLENITKLVNDGKLIVAGPLGKNDKSYRGIFILSVASIAEAKEILKSDPAISEGLLEAELYDWYGSAALPEYLISSDKIWKLKP